MPNVKTTQLKEKTNQNIIINNKTNLINTTNSNNIHQLIVQRKKKDKNLNYY